MEENEKVAPQKAGYYAAHAMSLNGLDSAPVVEAYQTALADAGGW
jgi:hypothetical protein